MKGMHALYFSFALIFHQNHSVVYLSSVSKASCVNNSFYTASIAAMASQISSGIILIPTLKIVDRWVVGVDQGGKDIYGVRDDAGSAVSSNDV